MAACDGVPLTQGVSSAELHIPGAASLANTASRVARASGVRYPLIGDIPSMSWRPMVRPRRRARSWSVKSPSGLRQSVSLSASLANSSGRCSPASRANWASALARGLEVDDIGQPMPKAPDDRDMAGAEVAVALGCGGGGQHRLQRFAGERPPLAQVGGFVDAPRCFGAADA